MTINLITFASSLDKHGVIYSSHQTILNELEKYFNLNILSYQDLDKVGKDDFCLLFIATGGVERLFIQYFEKLPRPALLLADGMQNSLASALEISAWLHDKGMKNEILHGELQHIIKRIFVLHNNFMAQRALNGMRIGVIGTPSPWLIASNVDYLLAKRRWGIQYTDIPIERLCDYYRHISDDEVGEAAAKLAGEALACRDASPDDMLKAMRIYHALQRIVKEENLNALTLSCYKLMEMTGVTGCLALSLLNDKGIVAGCEGDLQSVFTMLAVRNLTGQSSFMANLSMINTHPNEIVLSHCTVGLKQTDRFILRNHFESEQSIAIQGMLPTGDVTIVKCGGECLDEYYVTTGTLTENTNYINMCRTQVRVRLDTSSDYFLKHPLGNHHILVHGNNEILINEFMQANGCKRVE